MIQVGGGPTLEAIIADLISLVDDGAITNL